MIQIRVRKAISSWDRFRGLIGVEPDAKLFFQTRWGIHTFLMKSTIDVLIADNNLIVREIKKGLLPNRLFFWNPSYDKVIELPSGSIKKMKIRVGERLELIYNV